MDNRPIYVISNPPGIEVSFETDESWIILPDVKNVTTPAHVSFTVDPNMATTWRIGHVRFYSDGFNEAVLEVTQMGESVFIKNRKFQNYLCQLRVEKRVQVSGCRVQAMVFILCGAQINLLFLLVPEFLTLNSHT